MISKKATYIALTSHNPRHGWIALAAGNDKVAVLNFAREKIGDVRTDYGTDIYADTEHANLHVVSKTTAKREYGYDYDSFDLGEYPVWVG